MNKRGIEILEIIVIVFLVAVVSFTLVDKNIINLSPKSQGYSNSGLDSDSGNEERALGIRPTLTISTPKDGSTITSSSTYLNVTTNTNSVCYQSLCKYIVGGGIACNIFRQMELTGRTEHSQLLTGLENTAAVNSSKSTTETYEIKVGCQNDNGAGAQSSFFFVDLG